MLTIRIEPDEYNPDPRNDDNLGTMICFHRRYDLGDLHSYTLDGLRSWEEFESVLWANGAVAVLPLYLYDHSGISMATSIQPYWFHARWDSGQIGFIAAFRDVVYRQMGWCRLSEKRLGWLREQLTLEVQIYDKWLNNDFYAFFIEDEDGDVIESCGGFATEEDAQREAEAWLSDYTLDQ